MPRRPPKACAQPGCNTLTLGAYCAKHAKQRQRAQDRQRGSREERGYDWAWRKLRLWHLKQHPLCADCEACGRVEPAVDVDHQVPIAVDPSRRLDPSNLSSLCRRCHNRKTAQQRPGGGVGRISGH